MWPRMKPTATAVAMPATPTRMELTIALRSPMLTAKASPMMGSMRGATIMAPMTVATESPSSP